MEETSISSNAVISSSVGRRERLGEVSVDGRTDAIRDKTGLTAENAELRLRLQTMEQQAQLRDALNEALKHEVGRLKIATGETSSTGEANEVGLRKQRKSRPKRSGTKSLALQSLILPNPAATYKLPSPAPSFHQPQLTTANHPLLSYSHPLADTIRHDHLGRLQRLDISKGPLTVKSESSTISASESSSNF